MTRIELPGAWYADCLPSGEWAVLFPSSRVGTHAGPVDLPNAFDQPLFLRCTNVGGFKLAGQGSISGAAYLYDGTWHNTGTTHGTSPCIFDADGELEVATPAQGSQGYRYVDASGVLVTGDDTYDSTRRVGQELGLSKIWEYTNYGNVTIGQGEAYALAITPFGRKILEPGDCRFIRFTRVGDRCAVAIVKQVERKAVLFWFDVNELASLPDEGGVVVEPPPPPPPPPTQTMNYNTSFLQQYANGRWAQLPHSTREEQAAALFTILYEFRQRTGDPIEVFRKGKVGTHFLGSDNEGYAEDICVINEGANGKWYKDVGVAFGDPSASLNFGGEWLRPNGNDADRCFPPPQPIPIIGDPPPVGDPPPPPPNGDFITRAEFEAFKASLSSLFVAKGSEFVIELKGKV